MKYNCIVCKIEADQEPNKVKKGLAKFCSRKCKGEYQKIAYKGANNPFFGHKYTEDQIERLRKNAKVLFGPDHPKWKGGRCGKYWGKQCLERDDYICQVCGLRDEEIMQVDHIKPKSLFPELKFDLNNLRTICPNCHERKSRREKSRHYRDFLFNYENHP